MTQKLRVNSLFKLSALLLLSADQLHGYELISEIKHRCGQLASPGQVYPFLSTLEKLKLVKAKKAGSRDKKIYSLTTKGRGFLSKVLNDFDQLIEIAVKPKINQCSHCGCKVLGKGYIAKTKGKTLHFCCAACAGS